jgi:glycosyltransferase involved in cell wall biosynthesis
MRIDASEDATALEDPRASRRPGALSIGLGTPSWPLGGTPNGVLTYVATVAPALAMRGHNVSLFTSELSGPPGEFRVYNSRRVGERPVSKRLLDALLYRLAPRATWRAATRRDLIATVSRLVSEQHPDVLEMEESHGTASWVRRACSVPLHVRLHGPWFLNGPAVGAPEDATFRDRVRAEGEAIAEADVVSAPSRDVLERVRARYRLSLRDAAVIPNPTIPVPSSLRWARGGCDPDRILFVGRFDRHKGGDLLIEAFSRVLRERPGTRLTFVGPDRGVILDGGRTEHLEAFVRARLPGALEDGRIEWLGPRPPAALPPLRRGAFLTVVPSRYENFPGTVVEAMAHGCPVVAAAVGGIPEIVTHGVNGLLHRGGDAQDLAARMLELLRDRDLAARLGAHAARDADQKHHPDVVAGQLEALLARAADRGPRVR